MTSRLKHKLELENINLKSAYLNESFVQVSHFTFESEEWWKSRPDSVDRHAAARTCRDQEGQARICARMAAGSDSSNTLACLGASLTPVQVRDEKGRRRFHGAFTGGFSAGYYNTVGSKEGWTPGTFKSSRNNRATKVQRAEDFMDEEDLAAMSDDRRLENTETFKDEGFAGMRETMGEKRFETGALRCRELLADSAACPVRWKA